MPQDIQGGFQDGNGFQGGSSDDAGGFGGGSNGDVFDSTGIRFERAHHPNGAKWANKNEDSWLTSRNDILKD